MSDPAPIQRAIVRRPWIAPGITALAALLPIGALAASGHFSAWFSPDTASYLASDGLGQMRLPLYGWLLRQLPGDGPVVPVLQAGSYILAACLLVMAIQRAGGSRAAALAIGLALAWSNLVLLWSYALVPEFPGHAALLLALAATLEVASGRSGWRGIAVAAGAVTLAWALRPSLLPCVLLLPLLPLALRPQCLLPPRRAIALWLAIACLVPPLLLCTVRLARYGDFNITSFGGFQMSGMAALMLTPEIAARLPLDSAPLAREVLAGREKLEAAGAAIAVPLNSTGHRSFVSAAVFYFDILARTHDTVLYGAVAPLQAPGEMWPAFNQRLQRLAVATVKAAPVSYGAWVVGATSRLVGHALVLNPCFLLAAAMLLLLAGRPVRAGAPGDLRLLLVLVGVYTVGTGALAVLITFPASRYIDSAALMLAALPFHGVLRRLG